MNRTRLGLGLLAGAVLLAAAACGDDDDGGDAGGLRVFASNTIVADWVEQVGGDLVNVETIVPAGADLHTFQLTPGDVTDIADADLVVFIGAGLESPFEDAVRENAGGPVVELSEGLTLRESDDHAHEDEDDHAHEDEDDHANEDEDDHADEDGDDHDHGPLDPHIWMDIDLAVAATERIAQELGAIDPENADQYAQRADDYSAELTALDDELDGLLANLTAEQRLMVTFHDAYGYLEDAYGLEILGFVVENADQEPSAARVADLIDEMRERGATVIYLEPQFDSRAVEQIASDTDAEIRRIPSDSLTDDYPSYTEFMRAVAAAIAGE